MSVYFVELEFHHSEDIRKNDTVADSKYMSVWQPSINPLSCDRSNIPWESTLC